jgi:hypothetical protein
MVVSILVSFSAHEEGQPFDAFDYAALAAPQWFVPNITGVPGCATQFGFPEPVQVNLFGCDGGFADQTINVLAPFPLRQLQKPFTEQPEGEDGENRKQDALKPQRAREVEACQYADDHGANSEKDNIEPPRREQLRQEKTKA